MTAEPGTTQRASEPRATAAQAADCPPQAASSRLADPGVRDPHAVSPERAAELDRRLRQASAGLRVPNAAARVTIPVVVHVISAQDGTGNVPKQMVEDQIAGMNKAFSGGYGGADTGIRFALRRVTRTAHDAWFRDPMGNDEAIKRGLRRGDAGTLNLYTVDMGRGVLGRSTFPQDYDADSWADGVTVDYRTLPGGGRERFDLGHTATHETGHWLGLFHTFQNGCAHPSDYVDDTPYERQQSAGCPEDRDTCPENRGPDPIRNFMNYSDDSCMREFTAGQGERMRRAWVAFRA
ncbi:zinc metalloprotease [Marinitenerispora sediminis]|uniref:Zinc metalloprotease n=3 Tax=Marinitenerispora sediminis TaxID=1931232 RepID=A0A368T904_9ACTN|nr:zinc metalloprotease [Marinitenerispora sediminis]RCV60887.1 zinc metalloprotease [Marinitenerispora sediminis]